MHMTLSCRFLILGGLLIFFVFILERLDHGEASSACGTVRPGVTGPSDLNIKQTHHDQGIQLLRV